MHVRHTGETFYLCLFLLIFVPSGIFSNNDVRFSIKTYPFTAVHNDTLPQVTLDPLLAQLAEDSIDLGGNFDELNKARSVLAYALDKSKLVDKIAGGDWQTLPIVLQKQINNVTYTMGVTDVYLHPSFIQASVYLSIEIPQQKKVLYFGSPDIKFSSTGGIIGDARLGLLADYAINLGANKSLLILKGMYREDQATGCFVRIDCDGFKELSLDAEVLFSRDLVVPVYGQGEPKSTGRVRGRFSLICSDWNDILTTIELPDFAMSGYQDIAFSLNTAVIDLSDIRNDPAVIFPKEYEDPEGGGMDVTWRGVYVNSLQVILPRQFKKRNGADRLTFTANHLLLDHSGVSGHFFGGNLLTIDEGAMNKWSYSLDTVHAQFVQNRIKGFGFNGNMQIPIANSRKKQGIDYGAFMDEGGTFKFNAGIMQDMQFPIFQAGRVSIEKNSKVIVTVTKDEFLPEAVLFGDMSIQASLKGDKIDSPDSNALFLVGKLRFEGLHLSTIAPYMSVQHFDLGSGSALAKFPVNINNCGFKSQDAAARLTFGLSVNLVPENETAFGLNTVTTITGSMDPSSPIHQWSFNKFELDALELKMKLKCFSLDGRLYVFEDDPDYGTGFQGSLKAALEISTSKKFEFESNALFGRTSTYRYWYADGLAHLGNGVQLGGGLQLTGFGGGSYRKMSVAGRTTPGSAGLGVNASGIKYIPDEKVGLGIIAAVALAEVNPSLFSATATLDMAFGAAGGLLAVNFRGYGEFLAKATLKTGLAGSLEKRLDQLASPGLKKSVEQDKTEASNISGAIAASLFLNADFANDVFHGNLAIFVDIAHGTIRGASNPPGSYAGGADLLFTPGKWHIYLGTWDSRLAAALNLGALKGYAGAYFMTGNDLGAPPPLDPKIMDELGIRAESLSMDRSQHQAALISGSGLAFGANASIIFDYQRGQKYIHIGAGAGFEVYCIDYGESARCSNLPIAAPIGANGWRAGGNIYAFVHLSGKWFIRLPNIGLALLIKSDLPNPNQFIAAFKIIGIKFEINSGESCVLAQ